MMTMSSSLPLKGKSRSQRVSGQRALSASDQELTWRISNSCSLI